MLVTFARYRQQLAAEQTMLAIALSIFTSLILPLYAASTAWGSQRGGRLAYAMKAVAALAFMGFLAMIVPWHWLTVHLQWGWWAIVVALLGWGLVRMRDRRWVEGERRGALLASAFEPVVGIGLLGYAAIGLFPAHATAEQAFPLTGGSFVVGQGGNSSMLNYHNAHATQRYALDILGLDALGRRAEGLLPEALDAYVIYGARIVSPCAGEVIATVDGIAENAIGSTNSGQPAGNGVSLRCAGLDIELAHFIPGSVAVAPGDTVTAGQALGRVGNSGNSSEPHLHIHAVRSEGGDPVPLTFGGRFLARNAVVGN